MVVLLLVLPFLSLSFLSAQTAVEFTEQEERWIAENPVVHLVPDPEFAPIEFLDGDTYAGLAADLVQLVGVYTGLGIDVITPESWTAAMSMVRSGDADVLAAVTPTRQRNEYLVFTQPYLELGVVILTRSENDRRVGLEDLRGSRVGMMADYAEVDFVELMMPLLDINEYVSHSAALTDLSFGRIDYFVTSAATASHHIDRLGLANIVVVGHTDFRHRLTLGVRDDLPILRDILQKGLDAIPASQMDAIVNRWIGLDVPDPVVSDEVIRFIVAAFIVVFATLIFVSAWNRSLMARVAEKTAELNRELEARKKQTEVLDRSNREKEVLLHEIHHRVNNNMQTIMSIVSLEAAEMGEDLRRNRVERCIARINVIALAQERSHSADTTGEIDLLEFTQAVAFSVLERVRVASPGFITVRGDTDRYPLDVMVDFGMIVNELLLRAIKGMEPTSRGCDVVLARDDDRMACAVMVDVPDLRRVDFEGEKGELTNVLITQMLTGLRAEPQVSHQDGRSVYRFSFSSS